MLYIMSSCVFLRSTRTYWQFQDYCKQEWPFNTKTRYCYVLQYIDFRASVDCSNNCRYECFVFLNCVFSLILQGLTRGRSLKRHGTSSTLSTAAAQLWQFGQTSAIRKLKHLSQRRRSRWRHDLFNRVLCRKQQKTFKRWKAFHFALDFTFPKNIQAKDLTFTATCQLWAADRRN